MDEGKYDALQTQVDKLRRENQAMQTAIAEVAKADTLSKTVYEGFENLIAQLQPLRDLTPHRDPLDESVAAAVDALLGAMKGVKLTGDSLEVPVVNIPFIGEPRPDAQPDPYKVPGKTKTKQAL